MMRETLAAISTDAPRLQKAHLCKLHSLIMYTYRGTSLKDTLGPLNITNVYRCVLYRKFEYYTKSATKGICSVLYIELVIYRVVPLMEVPLYMYNSTYHVDMYVSNRV